MRILAATVIALLLGIFGYTRLSDDEPAESPVATDSTEPQPAATVRDDEAAAAGESPASSPTVASPQVELPPDLGPVEELVDISGWLNTTGSTFEAVRGEVTIVQFWTFGCSNCRATIPHLQELYAARHDDGLEIIGVHAPEFDYERDPDNVAQAAEDLGVVWPIALDADKATFQAWQGWRRFWPRTYVIDTNDRIRFDHIGEGAYEELAGVVDQLLAASS